jgi:hypothetical protein
MSLVTWPDVALPISLVWEIPFIALDNLPRLGQPVCIRSINLFLHIGRFGNMD